MHDGAPAYFSLTVRDILKTPIMTDGYVEENPIAWTPRSPDFNPPDFHLWGYLKPLVYAAPVDNEEAFHHRIVDACQTIRNQHGFFEQMRRSMMRRVELCSESHREHFEDLF
jgi:hypothetical protein